MWRSLEIKRSHRSLAVHSLLVALLLCVFITPKAVWALEMDLMQGQVRKGGVTVIEREGFRFAALDQILTNLGMASSPVTGGLITVYSEKKIEFWSGSNIARVNGAVLPLTAAVFHEDGHWWGEIDSSLRAISQFLSSASRPSDLSWAPSNNRAPSTANIPVAPKLDGSVAQPAQQQRPAQPEKNVPATRVTGSSVEVTRVRWGEQAESYRAVVDISAQTEVRISESSGRLEVVFPGASTRPFTQNSPWSPLVVEASQSGRDAELTFTHSASRVKSFWVQDPPRYVIDFYFSENPSQTIAIPPSAGAGTINTVPNTVPGGAKKYLVVVDAGHGGHDPGAVGNGLREKDLNLKGALELSTSLKSIGMDVKLTRADDRYLKLAERTAFANSVKADIFISLHCNALPKGQRASGVELYLMDQPTDRAAFNLALLENREIEGGTQDSAEQNEVSEGKTQLLMKILIDMQQNDKLNESTALAEFLYNRTRAAGYSLRKVRQAPLFVLRGAEMPALLVEMGYITDAGDAKNLNSQAYRKKMMDAIAIGILDYLKRGSAEGGRS
jgi:N-acetylmuramoyl-L-alanine amidase